MPVIETIAFANWLSGLGDRAGRARIVARIHRIQISGSLGDHKSVGDGVSELPYFFGPGYRVYFCQRGGEIVILLGGGDKGSQSRDVASAKALAKEV